MDGKPQLKLVIFWKIRLELSGEASSARRDQAKDNVFRPGCKFYSPEMTEPPQNSRGLRNVSGSSLVRCYIHFREGIREKLESFIFQEFILVSTVT